MVMFRAKPLGERKIVRRPASNRTAPARPNPPKRRIPPSPLNKPTSLPFLSLPPELRLEIYSYLLLSPTPIIITPKRRQLYNHPLNPHLDHRPHVSLLTTCRQINAEAIPILYGKNTFIAAELYRKPRPITTLPNPNPNPFSFFLWNIRLQIISLIPSLSFIQVCNCQFWTSQIEALLSHAWVMGGSSLLEYKVYNQWPYYRSRPDRLFLFPREVHYLRQEIDFILRLQSSGIKSLRVWPFQTDVYCTKCGFW